MKTCSSKKQNVITKIKEGYPITVVSSQEKVNRTTITKWLVEYISSGEKLELFGVGSVSRVQSLSSKQIEWIYFVVTTKSPADIGLPGKLWNRNTINKLIRHWCQSDYPTDSAYKLTKELGFDFPQIDQSILMEKNEISESLGRQNLHFFYLNSFELVKSFKLIPKAKGKRSTVISRARNEPTNSYVLYAHSLHKKGIKFIVDSKDREASVNYFINSFANDFHERAHLFIEEKSLFDNVNFTSYVNQNFGNVSISNLVKRGV